MIGGNAARKRSIPIFWEVRMQRGAADCHMNKLDAGIDVSPTVNIQPYP